MNAHRTLFTTAALFNFLVAALLVFGNATTWKLFGMAPPRETLFVQLFAVFVALFGAVYAWIGIAPAGKRPLIQVSAFGKLTIFATVVGEAIAGNNITKGSFNASKGTNDVYGTVLANNATLDDQTLAGTPQVQFSTCAISRALNASGKAVPFGSRSWAQIY